MEATLHAGVSRGLGSVKGIEKKFFSSPKLPP
jgi:hypothetical protein